MFERMSNGLKHPAMGWMAVGTTLSAPDHRRDTSGLTEPTSLEEAPVRSAQAQRIDALLAGGLGWLSFPQDLEDQFQQDNADRRLRWVMVCGALVALVSNILLLPDWLMVPDTFDLAVRLRLFAFTPLVLVGIFILSRMRMPWLREWATVAPGLVSTGTTALLAFKSQDGLSGPYLISLIPIILFSNSVAHMRLRPALTMDLIVLAMYGVVWANKPDAPLAIMVPATLTLLSSMVFTLYGCYTIELDARRNWLLRQRETCLLGDLEQANADLDAMSRSDMLTQLANRRHFDEYLLHLWERARMNGTEVALMMIDVDHFKAYNDRYGHPEGDACLKDVAATLKRRLRRPGDLIARFGGEEFIAVLAGTSLDVALGAAERVRKGVENLNRLHAKSPTHAVITVSIGVATLRPNAPHATPAQLISAADEALYQAKARGRNRVYAFGTHD
jgi:diguanylate cyclase (GGDEF)-like protein